SAGIESRFAESTSHSGPAQADQPLGTWALPGLGRPASFILRGVDEMETTRTQSKAQMWNRTQPTDESGRGTVDSTREQVAVSEFRMLIGGKLVVGAGTLDVINPATGQVLTTAPRADRDQLEQAVAAAKAAFPSWAATPLRVRGRLLVRLADALEAEQ